MGKILGVYWTRDDAIALFTPRKRKKLKHPKDVWYPLSFMLQPESEKAVKDFFGSPLGINAPAWIRRRGEEVVEGIDMDREQFKQFAGMFIPLLPNKG